MAYLYVISVKHLLWVHPRILVMFLHTSHWVSRECHLSMFSITMEPMLHLLHVMVNMFPPMLNI